VRHDRGNDDLMDRLELLAMRAVRREQRQDRRRIAQEKRDRERKDAVERRKLHQMRAADYARNRRANETTNKEG